MMTLIHWAKPVLSSLGKHWQEQQLAPHRHSGLGWQGRGSSSAYEHQIHDQTLQVLQASGRYICLETFPMR